MLRKVPDTQHLFSEYVQVKLVNKCNGTWLSFTLLRSALLSFVRNFHNYQHAENKEGRTYKYDNKMNIDVKIHILIALS